ncbi:MAG: adenylate/guanylate cyclase domain-containing protein, partial [Anaerolineae bacterium]|nr:adenylate/guanylate cyclase domain-containing protein [Anaerolineae bacterium]
EIILSDPEKHLQLGGETRPVTVFFADIRGFTTFAEQHRAGDVLALLNHFFNELTEINFQNQGTFDKYIGDSIMAFFGAPIVGDNDALNAARAALEMQSMFARLKRSVSHLNIESLGLGIGLHSGDAAVGNVGSERVMSYTVIGDTVNTAYRLEQVAESGMTLMSAATYHLLQEQILAEPLSPIPLKGKRDPQMVYSLIGLK